MRLFLVSLLLLFGVGLVCFAAAPPPKLLRADDQLDYLFLGSDRPVLIRLHLRMGDKPYDAPWNEFMDKLFAWFDKDGDGSLSPVETARLPSPNSLLDQTLGNVGVDAGGVPFAAIDTNKDGKVSKEEFRAFYRRSGFSSFRFVTNNQATIAKQINDGIFKRLDKAGEGHLTAAKVAGMYEKLRALDVNEDEMLDWRELISRPMVNNNSGMVDTAVRPALPVHASNLMQIDPGREASLVEQLMGKYDRNKDGKLTQAEVGFPPALFASLDADKDGLLDAGELWPYLATPPDLVLRLQVGTPTARKGIANLFALPRLVVVNDKTLRPDIKNTFRRAGTDSIAVELGDTRVAFQTARAPSQNLRFNDAKGFYLPEFDRIAGKKGHVERTDEKGQKPFLFQIFSQADKNADGKLTRVELIDWLDFVVTAQDTHITIMASDFGRGILPVLDVDGDGRLSLREMKTAWTRLKPLSKDGKVTRADLPRIFRIIVGSGTDDRFGRPFTIPGALLGFSRPATGSAPVWFRKMDRNNDGDVSRKEWLGTDEDFEAIDTDGDGLISVEEALAFEAKKKDKE